MHNKSGNIVILAMLAFLAAMVAPAQSYAKEAFFPGARIVGGNCDPGADTALDEYQTLDRKKSCSSQNIVSIIEIGAEDLGGEPFKVVVNYRGDRDVAGQAVLQGIIYTAAAAAGGAGAIAYTAAIMAFLQAIDDIDIELPITNESVSVVDESLADDPELDVFYDVITLNGISDPISFRAEQVGDKACVYAEILGVISIPVHREGANGDEIGGNCIPLPPPRSSLKPPKWGSFISEVCTDYDRSSSRFRYEPTAENTLGENRSFIGVAVQCIEDTMNNIFKPKDGADNTLFTEMQDKMKGFIRAMLALYVIFFGYRFVLEAKGIKQTEWQWFALKAAMVLYFAAGPGMTQLSPQIHSVTKGMSLIVLEAGIGDRQAATAAQATLEPLQDIVAVASAKVSVARMRFIQGGQSTSLEDEYYEAINEYDVALAIFNEASGQANSYGYDYCSFSGFSYGNNEYMKIWDMIDCRISKYLGVGDFADAPSTPAVITMAFAGIFATIFGPIIVILVILFLIFVILIILRIVHIYILSFIAVVMLVYISPLVIPTMLFEFTKSIFEKWWKFILGYMIQPIILFAFLTFMFAAFDWVYYGGNHEFVQPENGKHSIYDNKLCMKTQDGDEICSVNAYEDYIEKATGLSQAMFIAGTVDTVCDGVAGPVSFACPDVKNMVGTRLRSQAMAALKCADEDAIACIMQKTDIVILPWVFGLEIYHIHLTYTQGRQLMYGFLALIFICFIVNAALGLVEDMAGRLTNTTSAAGMSSAPNPGQFTAKVAGKGAAGVKKGYNKAKEAILKSKDKKSMDGDRKISRK